MEKWCNIKLYKQGKEYDFDLSLCNSAIILFDCWENIIPDAHRAIMATLLDKMRVLDIPVIHANHGNPSVIPIKENDIVLPAENYSIKHFPKYLFYAGYEIDKCLLGRAAGIPYAAYENKVPILIKDLTESVNIPAYYNLSPYLMKQAAINIIEHCYGFTTTVGDVMRSLDHTVITTAKRTVIEMGKVLLK